MKFSSLKMVVLFLICNLCWVYLMAHYLKILDESMVALYTNAIICISAILELFLEKCEKVDKKLMFYILIAVVFMHLANMFVL